MDILDGRFYYKIAIGSKEGCNTGGVKFTNGGPSCSSFFFLFLFLFLFISLFPILETTRVRVDPSRRHTSHMMVKSQDRS